MPLGCPPVLLLIFNRPEPTREVFRCIRSAAPRKLFVAADGPRQHLAGERDACELARAATEFVDWECDVERLYQETNLGCKGAVSAAITWFFEHVEEGIILEDDCVAHQTFFPFCAELLERYRDEKQIMAISGCNFQHEVRLTPYSYYFSNYLLTTGWATWRRAWAHYDGFLALWPELCRTPWLSDVLCDEQAARYWREIFHRAHAGEIDSWAHPWLYSCWVQNGLAALPEVNLISNIGWGEDATHTTWRNKRLGHLPTATMRFPLLHPEYVACNRVPDRVTVRNRYGPLSPPPPPPFYRRVASRILRLFPQPLRERALEAGHAALGTGAKSRDQAL